MIYPGIGEPIRVRADELITLSEKAEDSANPRIVAIFPMHPVRAVVDSDALAGDSEPGEDADSSGS